MGKLTDLLRLAGQRAEKMDLPYAGALTPREACEVWQLAPGAKLVDVRSRAERDWIGHVPGAIEIELLSYPDEKLNPAFLATLKREVETEALVLFLCRSGVRSDFAARAAHQAGYTEAYNILEGFEGETDANGQRGHIGGWRHAGLPWCQN